MDTPWLEEREEGFWLRVKITPGSPQNSLKGFNDSQLLLNIKGAPEKGKANKNMIAYLSKTLKIPQKEIIILQGSTSRNKKLLLHRAAAERLKIWVQEKDQGGNH